MKTDIRKILIIGSNSSYAVKRFYMKELTQQSFNVCFFDSRSGFNSLKDNNIKFGQNPYGNGNSSTQIVKQLIKLI